MPELQIVELQNWVDLLDGSLEATPFLEAIANAAKNLGHSLDIVFELNKFWDCFVGLQEYGYHNCI